MKPSHRTAASQCRAAVHDELTSELCRSVSDVLARVGDKRSILVIYMLSLGAMRFSQLKRSLGSISQKVLTSTLRGLERDGCVSRSVTPTIPPRVDYELTPLGHEVLVPVTALATWAFQRRTDVEQARQAFDQQSSPS